MITALAIVATLGAMLVFLLASASADATLFAQHTLLLIGMNALAALVLLGLVAAQLRRLWRDYRGGVFGARLKSRLLLMLALMAVAPGALVYAVSMQFAVNSIDSWFDVRIEAALDGGLDLGHSVLDAMRDDLLVKGRSMAYDLAGTPAVSPVQLNRLREQAGVQGATLLTAAGQLVANSGGGMQGLLPILPSAAQLRQARLGSGIARVEGDPASGLVVHALIPVASYRLGSEPLILQLEQSVPTAITQSAALVESARRDYQELQLGRSGLKRLYTLTLTFSLLLALFAAVALAFFLAARLAKPLLILAEGTRAVAAGDLTPRAALATDDELGVLTRSFNTMTAQLSQARGEREAAHAYLEGVLTNLSTGVLAFDGDFMLRAANRGACAILGDDLCATVGRPLVEWPDRADFKAAIHEAFAGSDEWQRQLEIDSPSGTRQILLLRGSTLPAAAGRVVVFDDISPVIVAQRAAAWGEVAQRLAHEIKNPLTPIQLSAERLQMKLADKLDPASAAILGRATRTIVDQVESMKNMVNDFRDYARLPPPMPTPMDLNALVAEVLELYEDGPVAVSADLDPALPPVLADADQLRQVLHNLIKNASEAMAEKAGAAAGSPRGAGGLACPAAAKAVVTVTTKGGRMAQLTVADNGPGFPAQILARAFEPYVTTKAKGTGLGLAIVRKIVDDHGGTVNLANRTSEQGGGAEVSVQLPLHQHSRQGGTAA
ncbi:MAG: HAMP domain-containing protein [Gammaproteobacteria bacterium]|nr:HAMP domain-containing protein [Rhodocyclaceae bacterium]MBU3909257.1 HAMP domain-containing protein [Gammaproteobacteria bacterium]MBU3989635.1 HAMP domain-containing protein [Gammaproteobacteria bacterium]MBU4005583.1 HAMP domain-containing protein [Gammaproteobacteria bacterium]MBU4020864.1 HAMP domain-containing protein [Gammaproteobacteria bacterium]